MQRLTGTEKTVLGLFCEWSVALGALLLGALQFIDDGGSLLFQLAKEVLHYKYAVGLMFLGMGLGAMVMSTALTVCREMRMAMMLGHLLLWGVVVWLYVSAYSVRPIVAMALLMVITAFTALHRLVADHVRRR